MQAGCEQRIATFLVYLTDVPAGSGGQTIFPLLRRDGRLMPQDMERFVRAAVQPLQRARARARVCMGCSGSGRRRRATPGGSATTLERQWHFHHMCYENEQAPRRRGRCTALQRAC